MSEVTAELLLMYETGRTSIKIQLTAAVICLLNCL